MSKSIDPLQDLLDSLPELTPEQRAQLDDIGEWIVPGNRGFFYTEQGMMSPNGTVITPIGKTTGG